MYHNNYQENTVESLICNLYKNIIYQSWMGNENILKFSLIQFNFINISL